MNIEQVQDVLTIAKYENFSRAANELYISQSALSLRLKRLEEEIGLKLFDRTPQAVKLTEEGALFCQYAEPVMESWEQFLESLENCRNARGTALRVGLTLTANARGLLAPVIDFIRNNPDREVNITFSTVKGLLEGLTEERIDAAILQLSDEPGQRAISGCQYYFLREYETCLLVSKDNPLASRASITPVEMEHLPFIQCINLDIREDEILNIKKNFGITPNVVFRTDDLDASYRAIREGIGVRIGSQALAGYYGLSAIPISSGRRWYLHMILTGRAVDNIAAADFRDHILEEFDGADRTKRDVPYTGGTR